LLCQRHALMTLDLPRLGQLRPDATLALTLRSSHGTRRGAQESLKPASSSHNSPFM
jgi:hypothetical protein